MGTNGFGSAAVFVSVCATGIASAGFTSITGLETTKLGLPSSALISLITHPFFALAASTAFSVLLNDLSARTLMSSSSSSLPIAYLLLDCCLILSLSHSISSPGGNAMVCMLNGSLTIPCIINFMYALNLGISKKSFAETIALN